LHDKLTGQPIPALIVFERRGDKLGYHIVTSLQGRIAAHDAATLRKYERFLNPIVDLLAEKAARSKARRTLLR
jgi:hypothetical protein